MNRRQFLKFASCSAALTLLPGVALAARVKGAPANRRLVVLFLRGAADGLSIVAPYGDPDYASARPNIAIAPPRGSLPHTATRSR